MERNFVCQRLQLHTTFQYKVMGSRVSACKIEFRSKLTHQNIGEDFFLVFAVDQVYEWRIDNLLLNNRNYLKK